MHSKTVGDSTVPEVKSAFTKQRSFYVCAFFFWRRRDLVAFSESLDFA